MLYNSSIITIIEAKFIYFEYIYIFISHNEY